MFCPNCGAEVNGGSFCPKCGTRVATAASNGAQQIPNINNQMPYMQAGTTPMQNRNPKSGKIGVVIGIIVAVLVIIIAVSSIVKKHHNAVINFDDYVTVEFEGKNSKGTARIVFNHDAFISDCEGKIKVNLDKPGNIKAIREAYKANAIKNGEDVVMSDGELDMEIAESLEFLKFSYGLYNVYEDPNIGSQVVYELLFDGSLDQDKGLSNGDTVIYTWEFDEFTLEMMEIVSGCQFEYSEKIPFMVMGLE